MYGPFQSRSNGHSILHQATPRIAMMRALPGLGDFLCLTPALRALRAALPQAHITLIGLPQTRPLVGRFSHYVDELLPFPGFPGIMEVEVSLPRLFAFLNEVQGRFDLALQLHGSGEISNQFVSLLGASYTAGFYLSGRYCPDPARFLPYPASEPEVCRHLRLMAFLGVPLQGTRLEFPVGQADEKTLAALPEVVALEPGRYICIHAGASDERRCWSPRHFAAVADELAAQGHLIVLTGSEAEQARAAAVQEAMRHEAIDLTGRTSLGTLAALLSKAALVICNDTGVSHLADALAVPSVVIFQNADDRRWAPLDKTLHRVVRAGEEYEWQPDPFTEAAVLEAAQALLAGDVEAISP